MLSYQFKHVAGNIEEYVTDFLKVYKESSYEDNTVKQITGLQVQLEKEKAKREKLLDLYTDDIISREDFKKETIPQTLSRTQLLLQ